MKRLLFSLVALVLMFCGKSVYTMEQPDKPKKIVVTFSNQSDQIVSIFSYKFKEKYEHNLKAFYKTFILDPETDSPEFTLETWSGLFLATQQGPYEITYFHNHLGYRGIKLDKIREITPKINIINLANPTKVLVIISPDGEVQLAEQE